MHEASLALPLLRLVLEETARHGREQAQRLRVTCARVRVGLLVGVDASALQGIFALMAEGTAAEGACLVVESEPMRGSCPDCGAGDFLTDVKTFRCPVCGGENADWAGGNELYVASIEVQTATGT